MPLRPPAIALTLALALAALPSATSQIYFFSVEGPPPLLVGENRPTETYLEWSLAGSAPADLSAWVLVKYDGPDLVQTWTFPDDVYNHTDTDLPPPLHVYRYEVHYETDGGNESLSSNPHFRNSDYPHCEVLAWVDIGPVELPMPRSECLWPPPRLPIDDIAPPRLPSPPRDMPPGWN